MNGDLELDISPGSGRGQYVVRVLRAPAGSASPCSFSLDVDRLLEDRPLLESMILASAVSSRRTKPFEELEVQRIGKKLFSAIFSREIYGTYRASLGAAYQSGQQLRLVLTLSAPELAALPWEMLFDPETETYLCRTEPLVRRIPAPAYQLMPLVLDSPFRILGIIASPPDLSPLNANAEKRNLEQALDGAIRTGRIELVWVSVATWGNIHEALLNGPWHVVHFIGHGQYDSASDEGKIAMVNHEGTAESIEANRLVDLFSAAQPVPRLVVLNSCSSGESGASDLFSSTASALVRGGIHAVAAMQFAISDTGAIAFARGFYTALANGRSVDEAARNGRIAIRGVLGTTLEWITPVLFVRPGSTQLFTFIAGPAPEVEVAEPTLDAETAEKAEHINSVYIQAHAELRIKNYPAAISLFDEVLRIDPQYRDAVFRRDEAKRISGPIVAYEKAVAAEKSGDFRHAEKLFAAVLEIDAAFRDAAQRLRHCVAKQQIRDLEAEMRIHFLLERWQAVLDANGELLSIDPSAADPDGLATRAARMLSHGPKSTDPRGSEAAAAMPRETVELDFVKASKPAVSHSVPESDPTSVAGHRSQWTQPFVTEVPESNAADFQARLVTTLGLRGVVDATSFSPDGALLAVSEARRTGIWDFANDNVRYMDAPRERTSVLVFNRLHQLGALSRDIARVFNPSSGELLASVRSQGSVMFRAMGFMEDGIHFVTLDASGAVDIWDISSSRKVDRISTRQATSAAFAEAGTKVAIANEFRGDVEIWDILNQHRILWIEGRKKKLGQASRQLIALSGDATQLATFDHNSPLSIRDSSNGVVLLHFEKVDVRSVVFSTDGRWLAATSTEKALMIWDSRSGHLVYHASHVDVDIVAFSPSGTHCALGIDRKMAIWELVPVDKGTEVKQSGP